MPSRGSPASVERLTAADAEARQRRMAGSLRAAGLGAGDRVAFCLPSSGDLLCGILGATRSGVVPVLLNATLTDHERAPLVEDCQPGLVVDTPAALRALAAGPDAELAARPLTRAMHYTSGTSGRPKGVVGGPWDDTTAARVLDDEADLWGFDGGDVHLVCSPLYHSVSARFAGGTLLRGGACLVMDRFDATTALATLRRERPTTAFMVPSHLQRLLGAADLGADERFDSLRLLVHAGEPCPPGLKRAVMDRCREGAVWEFYGSTEGQFTICSPEEWLERPGTVGRARPGRRLEIDPAGLEDPAELGLAEGGGSGAGDDAGVIWCHAPAFSRFEYWRNPEATAAAWRGDAFTVGDIGRLDAGGYLYFSGRRQDLIISGGVNVYPAEVEAVLSGVPGVREVAVFGLPDPRWGQRVCAAVVADRGLTPSELEEVASRRLAPHKRPKQYEWVDDLPHTATGKLRRGAVARMLGLS
jgi:long-chain acyl-CoA synthetase